MPRRGVLGSLYPGSCIRGGKESLFRRARSDRTAKATTTSGGSAYKFMVANAVFVAEIEISGCVGVLVGVSKGRENSWPTFLSRRFSCKQDVFEAEEEGFEPSIPR